MHFMHFHNALECIHYYAFFNPYHKLHEFFNTLDLRSVPVERWNVQKVSGPREPAHKLCWNAKCSNTYCDVRTKIVLEWNSPLVVSFEM